LLRIDLYSNLGDCISKCYHDISDIVAEDGLNPVLSDDVKKCQQCYSPSPLREILSRDFGLLTISYEILGKLFLGNPQIPRWHLYPRDDSIPPCLF